MMTADIGSEAASQQHTIEGAVPDLNVIPFLVWSAYVYRYQAPSAGGHAKDPETVQRALEKQEDELSKIDTPDKHHESEVFDENHIKDEDVIERVSKRFGRAVPLDKINIVMLMDMSQKHASIEQFEPMN